VNNWARTTVLMMTAFGVLSGAARAGEAPPTPVSAEEKARLLAAETPEQKKLREEIKALGGKVYFSCGGRIYTVGLDGSAEKLLVEMPEGGLDYPHVSPDGRKIVFGQGGSKARPADFLIKKLDEKAAPVDQRDMRNTVTWIANADGTEPKPLGYFWTPHWMPDGKGVIGNLNMKGKRNRPIAMLELGKMEEHVVSPPDWASKGSCGFAVCTSDGKWALSTNQSPIAIPLNDTGTGMADGGALAKFANGPTGCNTDVSRDGKWVTWTIDTQGEAGGWICYAPLQLPAAGKGEKARLGWQEASVNYDSDFSPDGKYLVYMHGEIVPGKASYSGVPSEIYVTRFPPDGVNVRVTWLGGNARHPHWVTASGAWK
jgi:dipeptidyl aminopeptidase/acylaminoacyl peptidase